MTEFITESGMKFIAKNTFSIETDAIYTTIRNDRIRSVEFIRIKDDLLYFIEAKTSFPNPYTAYIDRQGPFNRAVQEVCDKFKHSLNLFASANAGIVKAELPEDFGLPRKTAILFILVIRNHELAWCDEVKGKLWTSLPYYLKKIWQPKLFVVNYEKAIEMGIAS